MCDGPDCTVPRVHCVIPADGTLGAVSLTKDLIDAAHSAGANSVGVARAAELAMGRSNLKAAIDAGRAGPLGFTYDDPDLATDIRLSLSWARYLVVFGVSYIGETSPPGPSGPVIGRFATEDFYRPLRAVASAVTAGLTALGHRAETLIDDNRLADRSAAITAGVGWAGRSTMVLAPGIGPWMLLGTVVTDAHLHPTEPMRRDCGTCTACIPACPTGAIQDGALDARRCLSTWLQTPGSIPHWIRPLLGRRVYGCDDCLTSCPPGHPAMRAAQVDPLDNSFTDLLALDDPDLIVRFSWWFVPRRDGRYIRRNLLVAAGNSEEPQVEPILLDHLGHASSMIRGHAAWALARMGGQRAHHSIRAALDSERTPEGREEMLLALMMLESPDHHAELLEADEMVTTSSDLIGLAVAGVPLDGNDARSNQFKLVPVRRDSPPDLSMEDLASIIRVNDRERHIERLRRAARDEIAPGNAV